MSDGVIVFEMFETLRRHESFRESSICTVSIRQGHISTISTTTLRDGGAVGRTSRLTILLVVTTGVLSVTIAITVSAVTRTLPVLAAFFIFIFVSLLGILAIV